MCARQFRYGTTLRGTAVASRVRHPIRGNKKRRHLCRMILGAIAQFALLIRGFGVRVFESPTVTSIEQPELLWSYAFLICVCRVRNHTVALVPQRGSGGEHQPLTVSRWLVARAAPSAKAFGATRSRRWWRRAGTDAQFW